MKFSVRVAGILLNHDRLLVHESQQQGRTYYALPGGHLEAGETTKDCLVREIHEEFGLSVEVGKLVYIAEGFFIGGRKQPKPKHEIVFYYLMQTADQLKHVRSREKKIQAAWLELSNLDSLYPHWLQTYLPRDVANQWQAPIQQIIADERDYSGEGKTKSSDSTEG